MFAGIEKLEAYRAAKNKQIFKFWTRDPQVLNCSREVRSEACAFPQSPPPPPLRLYLLILPQPCVNLCRPPCAQLLDDAISIERSKFFQDLLELDTPKVKLSLNAPFAVMLTLSACALPVCL